MKKIAIYLLTCWAAWQTFAAEGEWLTDLPKAQTKAKAENKMVLMDFTGSDWCGWCIKFHKEVLSTPEFAEYAKKHLVLVELDFPRKKQQPAELKQANTALQAKFQVNSFPTFVVLNAEGKEIGKQVGYAEGGPNAFIARLEGFKKKQS